MLRAARAVEFVRCQSKEFCANRSEATDQVSDHRSGWRKLFRQAPVRRIFIHYETGLRLFFQWKTMEKNTRPRNLKPIDRKCGRSTEILCCWRKAIIPVGGTVASRILNCERQALNENIDVQSVDSERNSRQSCDPIRQYSRFRRCWQTVWPR